MAATHACLEKGWANTKVEGGKVVLPSQLFRQRLENEK